MLVLSGERRNPWLRGEVSEAELFSHTVDGGPCRFA